jgi:hypothetical protein
MCSSSSSIHVVNQALQSLLQDDSSIKGVADLYGLKYNKGRKLAVCKCKPTQKGNVKMTR